MLHLKLSRCNSGKLTFKQERAKDEKSAEEYAKKSSQWIVQGMKDDAQKK
jgi:hypothetical protein